MPDPFILLKKGDIMEITDRIKEKLGEVELKENVRVLFCAESGSRSWGFASPDSDYDARFVYVRPTEYYLALGKTRDVIEWQLDDVYDINGWDIQKYLRLLYASNATVFEWNNSSIVYKKTDEWDNISALLGRYFNRRAMLGHYLGLAKGNYLNNLTGETVKLKKYFYSLRPVLCARWIIEKGAPPPMPFSELAAEVLDKSLTGEVGRLLELKSQASEADRSPHIEALDRYLEESIAELSELAQSIDPTGEKDWEPLDKAFRGLLGL